MLKLKGKINRIKAFFHNNLGFTLLEMLLVLMIVIAIFYIMIINLKSFKENTYLNSEIEFLGSAVDNIQSLALINDKEYKLKLFNSGFKVYENSKIIYEHKFDENIVVNTNFSANTISITDDGTLSRAGTVTYNLDDFSRKIIFDIGVGRYRIE